MPGLQLWRKSGTWRNVHADSVLVEHPGGRYILVAMVEGLNGNAILERLAPAVHRLVVSQGKPST